MRKYFGGPKRQFPATNHISGHFRPNGKSYFEKSKIPKFAKKSILAKNSNFDRVAGIGRNDDIWPEMGPWGVLESFCTSIRYFNAFRSIFMKFQKMPFLTCWNMIYGHFRVGRIFYGSKIGQPISAKAKTHLDPFPKNFPLPLIRLTHFFNQKNPQLLSPECLISTEILNSGPQN
mgnify:CR=1 FL=1